MLPQAASWQDQQGTRRSARLLHEATAGTRTIVGMWSFKMTADGRSGRFRISAVALGRHRADEQRRPRSCDREFLHGGLDANRASRYHLNHYALSYDSSGTLNAKVNIKEDVTVDANGMTYTVRSRSTSTIRIPTLFLRTRRASHRPARALRTERN